MPKKAKTRTLKKVGRQKTPVARVSADCPAPRSAWFVFGSNESLLTNADLLERGGKVHWTAPMNAEIGDIVFFYFISPEQSVHFMARVASQPVRKLWNQRGYQYWADCDSMIRIQPIHLTEIREIFGEKRLLVYAKGGMYICPDFANRLIEKTHAKCWSSIRDPDKVLRRVGGRTELGQPNSITLDGLRELASADFMAEAEVEYHVLEPLFRLAQIGQRSIIRKLDLPKRKTADYAVIETGASTAKRRRQKVLCIIEAKLNLGKRNNWAKNRHVKQAREYAKMCKAPGFVVMDRDRFVCFRTREKFPCLVLDRASLARNGLSALRAHLLNEKAARPIVGPDHPTSKTNRR